MITTDALIPIGDTLRMIAAELSAPDLDTDGRLALARDLRDLAERADEGRVLHSARGAMLGPDPMRETPRRPGGPRPALRGAERLYRREED